MLISIPARGIRFVLVTVVVHYAFKYLVPTRAHTYCSALILTVWILFYPFYFAVLPG